MLESTTNDDRRWSAVKGGRLARTVPLLACAVLVMACPEPDEDDGNGVTGTTGTSTSPTAGPGGTGDDTGSGTTSTDPTTPPDTGDTTDDDTSGDTTGVPLTCGDGQVQPPEACDDGNAVDADGCNSDCTISGSILFEHSQASGMAATDRAFGVAVDDSGNAYLVGELLQATNDAWVRQYTADDGLGFTLVTDSGVGDGARGVVARGNQIYVAGYANGNLTLINYDSNGNQGWSVNYAGPGSGTDVGHAVAVDSAGNVIVGGSHRVNYNNGVSNTPHDNVFVGKYTPAGAEAWTHNYGGPVNTGEDQVRGVTVDSADNVIVAGWESVSGLGREIWVRKFDPAGNPLWTMTHSGIDMGNDQAHAVATGPDDSIVVVGREIAAGLSTLWIRKYDPDGLELWTQTWTGDTAEGAHGLGVGIDDAGDITVTGLTVNAGVNEMFVHKYDPAGAMRWSTPIPGIGDMGSVGRAITIAPNQRIWAAGERDLGVDGFDLYVARLAQ